MPSKENAPAEESLPDESTATEQKKTPTEDVDEMTDSELEEVEGGEEEKKSKAGRFIEKIQSTVRQRKRRSKAATQRFIPISEIRNDTVILKNGGLRSVLVVEPLNFNLKSEAEQESIIGRYQNFLNTLTFPIQIVVSSTRVNIDPYIEKIRARAGKQTNPLLKEQSLMYAAFVEKLVDVADIMQKRFYLVVPQDDQPPRKNPFASFKGWFQTSDSAAKVSQRNQRFHQRSILLRDRVNLVQSGLHHVGIFSRRLNTQELIELYYQFYNPKTSQEQKLPSEMNTEKFVL